MPTSTVTRPDDGMVAFTVTLHVKPGREAEFLDLLTPVLDAMRHEPGFINGKPVDEAQHQTCFACHEARVKGHDFVFTRWAP